MVKKFDIHIWKESVEITVQPLWSWSCLFFLSTWFCAGKDSRGHEKEMKNHRKEKHTRYDFHWIPEGEEEHG